MVFLGIIIAAIALFILAKISDEKRRSDGRRRRNDLLTDFGYGSFGEGVKASVSSASWGCFGKIFVVVAIFAVMACFRGCD